MKRDDRDPDDRRPAMPPLPDWMIGLGAPAAFAAALAVALAALALVGRFVLAAFDDDPATPLRDLFLILAGVLGAPFVVWRTLVAQRQAVTGEDQARTALQANITARLNEAVRMLGATMTVKVRRRALFYRYKVGSEADWTIRHIWDYEGLPVDLPDWMEVEHGSKNWLPIKEWLDLTPEARAEKREFKDAEEQRPVIEVRLGALYALERISRDSARDHISVMEIICAYVRENAPGRDLPPLLPNYEPQADDALRSAKERVNAFWPLAPRRAETLSPPRLDIQAALTILGRRRASQIDLERQATPTFRLDLRGANLRRCDLSGANMGKALLREARLEGALLRAAHLGEADLEAARMEGADLHRADMRAAVLRAARLEGADIRNADMRGASLRWAKMEGTDLSAAQMEGADLTQARMEGADLTRTRMEGTDLSGAKLEGASCGGAILAGAFLLGEVVNCASLEAANLRGAAFKHNKHIVLANISCGKLTEVFADLSIAAPDHCARPAHWPVQVLTLNAFLSRWAGWRLSRGEPWPPPGRALANFAGVTPTPPDTPVAPHEIERP